jgi:hypothetical protein
MNSPSINPLLQEAQAPASFLSILATTAGQGIAGTATPAMGAAPRSREDAAPGEGSKEAAETAPKAAAQANVQEPGVQAAAATVVSSAAASVRSNPRTNEAPAANATERASNTNQKDAKAPVTPTTVAAPIPAPAATGAELPIAQPSATPGEQTAGTEKSQVPASQAAGISDGVTDGHEPLTANAATAAPRNQDAPAKGPQPETTDGSSNGSADTTQLAAAAAAAAVPQRNPVVVSQPNAVLPPALPLLPSAGETNTAGKPAQDKSADTTGVQNVSAVATPDKSHPAGSTNPTQGTDTQNSQPTGGQAAQHAQTDGTQAPAAAAAKNADATAMPTPIHDAPAFRHENSGDGPRPAEAMRTAAAPAEAAEATANSGINTARLIQTMSETEMHVGLHSAEFGDISIRTAISQQQVVAQISVDHSDLGRAIADATPGLQAKLGNDFGVHASIEVNQNGASYSGERGAASQQQQRSFAQTGRTESGTVSAEAESTGMKIGPAAGEGYRLDIRA